MKKICLLIIALSVMLVGCKPDPEKPTVLTKDVAAVTANTANVIGDVTNDGGAEVTVRGICWSTNEIPVIETDAIINSGSGIGSYKVTIENLTPFTTYYTCAYAINSEGTSYGEIKEFTTKEAVDIPTVTTNLVSDITETSVICGGNVVSDGGAEVSLRGLCWSTTDNPTIEDDLSMGGGSGVGSFEMVVDNLTPNTKYYIRAYAVNSQGTSYGEEVVFTTIDGTPPTSGSINGYEWVDLGLASGTKWATHNVGATTPEEYGDLYAWGEIETKTEYTKDNSVTHGVSMTDISGNPTYDVARNKWGSTWRMPKKNELEELYEDCEWARKENGYKVTGPNGKSIFLPAAGRHDWNGLEGVGSDCNYWGSTPYNDEHKNCAYEIFCGGGYIGFGASAMRCYGQSVRPVSD